LTVFNLPGNIKPMKELSKILIVIMVGFLLAGCVAPQRGTISKAKRIKIALIKYEMARNIIIHKDYRNLANAFKYLEEARKTLRNDPRVYYLLAIAYQLRGNTKEYEFYLKKTISIDKNFFDAYNALGIYYFGLRKYNKAIDMFTKLIKNPLYPSADVAFYNRALVYMSLGKTKYAIDDLRNAIVFSNYSNPVYYKALINLEIKNKMYLRALKDLTNMEDRLGESCFIELKKALCYIRIKEFNQALWELSRIKQTAGNCYDDKNRLLKEIENDNNTNN